MGRTCDLQGKAAMKSIFMVLLFAVVASTLRHQAMPMIPMNMQMQQQMMPQMQQQMPQAMPQQAQPQMPQMNNNMMPMQQQQQPMQMPEQRTLQNVQNIPAANMNFMAMPQQNMPQQNNVNSGMAPQVQQSATNFMAGAQPASPAQPLSPGSSGVKIAEDWLEKSTKVTHNIYLMMLPLIHLMNPNVFQGMMAGGMPQMMHGTAT